MRCKLFIVAILAVACAPLDSGPQPEALRECSHTPRSPKWPAARAAWLRDHPTCEACGGTANIEVHHVKDFADNPQLELDPANFITLCESPKRLCHFRVGHRWNYRTINTKSREDAAYDLNSLKHVKPIVN